MGSIGFSGYCEFKNDLLPIYELDQFLFDSSDDMEVRVINIFNVEKDIFYLTITKNNAVRLYGPKSLRKDHEKDCIVLDKACLKTISQRKTNLINSAMKKLTKAEKQALGLE